MYISKIFLIPFLFLENVSSGKSLNHYEYLITKSVMINFEIRHCIIVGVNDNVTVLKKFSSQNIISITKSLKGLLEYLKKGSFVNVETMVVMKEKNLGNLTEIFQILKELKLKHRTHHFTWLIFVESYKSLKTDAEKLLVPYDTRFLICYSNDNLNYDLMEAYNVRNRTFFTELHLLENEIIQTNIFLYSRRMDLNGTELEMSTNIDTAGIEINEDENFLTVRHFEIFNDTAKIMNFRFHYQLFNFDGSFDFDELPSFLTGEIFDIPMPFQYFPSDMFGPTYKSEVNWYIKYPETHKQADYYTQPFHPHFWGCILIFLIVGCVWSVAMIRLSELERISITDFVFLGLECFCNQIGGDEPKKISFRILNITFRMAALVIIPAYSATIASFLTVNIAEIPFMNLDEFIKNGRYVLANLGGVIENDFAESKNPTFRYVHDYLTVNHKQTGLVKFFEIFCSEKKVAYPSFDREIYKTADFAKSKCNFLKIQRPITFMFSGAPMKKYSQFKEVFNYNLMRFYSSGIINKWQKVLDDTSTGRLESDEAFEPVRVNQMVQVFSIVGIGIIGACVVFVLELLLQKKFFEKATIFLKRNFRLDPTIQSEPQET